MPVYSIILYDAVAGGAGHVRRIVTEDGAVFEKVLRRAYQIVAGCKCEPSCYSCIRNYYNQKIHDKLDRRKAANFLHTRLGALKPVQRESSAQNDSQTVTISGGEAAENYRSWEEIYDNYGFEGDDAVLDLCDIPRDGCVIMPEVKLGSQVCEPYLVWERSKVMLFDEPGGEEKQMLADAGWYVDTMETDAQKLAEILKGEA